MDKSFRIRPAEPRDVADLLHLIRALAEYEQMLERAVGTKEALAEALFGTKPVCEALLVERKGRAVGFALYYTTFSTFMCQPGLYLEDLFVEPESRRFGVGKALLKRLAALAVERGCGRFEWRVLDWNTPSIRFYESLGATLLPTWVLVRMDEGAFARLATKRT